MILYKLSMFGLCTETRAHEVEIVSNRKSSCYGEYQLNSAHTAHHAPKEGILGS